MAAQSTGNEFENMVYDIPVFAQITQFFDWFSGLVWYWQLAVGFGIILGVWLFLKIVATIFGSGDE
jgi:hypothetical protein